MSAQAVEQVQRCPRPALVARVGLVHERPRRPDRAARVRAVPARRELAQQPDPALLPRDARDHVERARGLRRPRVGRAAGVHRDRRLRRRVPLGAALAQPLPRDADRHAVRRRHLDSAGGGRALAARRRVRDRDVGGRRGLRDPDHARRLARRRHRDVGGARVQPAVHAGAAASLHVLGGARSSVRSCSRSSSCSCAAASARRCRRSATTRRPQPRSASASCSARASSSCSPGRAAPRQAR